MTEPLTESQSFKSNSNLLDINQGDASKEIRVNPSDGNRSNSIPNTLQISFPRYKSAPEYRLIGSESVAYMTRNPENGRLIIGPELGSLASYIYDQILETVTEFQQAGYDIFDLDNIRQGREVAKLEEEKLKNAPPHIYVHFTPSWEDAVSIAKTQKLYSCTQFQGKKDIAFAVDLTTTRADPRTQLWGRSCGVVFTTPEQGYEAEEANQVYWNGSKTDEDGTYLPLEMVFPVGPEEVQLIREILSSDSPEFEDWQPA